MTVKKYIWDRAGIELATPGSAVQLTTNCAQGPLQGVLLRDCTVCGRLTIMPADGVWQNLVFFSAPFDLKNNPIILQSV